uniref:gp53-like domain-containing protein n=2 Tax=Bacteroides finegoldii TaxID=338188 RepID=UPI001E561AA8
KNIMRNVSRKLVAILVLIIWLSSLGTKSILVESQSLGQNGYLKCSNGLLIQWGLSNSSGANTRINFPLSFYNDNYSITMGINGGVGTITSLSIIITERSSAYFKVKGTMGDSASTHDNSFYWIAIGVWK